MKIVILSLVIALALAETCQQNIKPAFFAPNGSEQELNPTLKVQGGGCFGEASENAQVLNYYYIRFTEDGENFEGTIEHDSLEISHYLSPITYTSLKDAVEDCENTFGKTAKTANSCPTRQLNSPIKIAKFGKNQIFVFVVQTFTFPETTDIKFIANGQNTQSFVGIPDNVCDRRCKGCFKKHNYCRACQSGQGNKTIDVDHMTLVLAENCECKKGTYYENYDCQVCSKYCETCSSKKKCLTCKINVNSAPIPTCQCSGGFFFKLNKNGKPKCKECSKKCETCLTKDQCITCKGQNRVLAQNCACQSKYYEEQETKKCEQCGELGICKDSKLNYQTCYGNLNRELKGSNCQCRNGYYEVFDGEGIAKPECEKCSEMCKSCKGDKFKCTECASTETRYGGKEDCPCKEGYKYNNNFRECTEMTCDPSCETCSKEQDSNYCSSCGVDRKLTRHSNPLSAQKAGIFLESLYTCDCLDGFYEENYNQYLYVYKICKECKASCSTCETYEKCSTCKAGFVLVGDSCQCPLGQFLNQDMKCEKCSGGCARCTSLNNCLQCNNVNRDINNECKPKPGYYEVDDCKVAPCMPGCSYCYNGNSCPACGCNPADHRELIDGKCQCKVKYFDIPGQLTCKPCGSGIQSCDCNDIKTCVIECLPNRVKKLGKNGLYKCVCDKGYTLNKATGECLPCEHQCQQCAPSKPGVCIPPCNGENRDESRNCSCKPRFYEDAANGVCKPCRNNCLKCTCPNFCDECDTEKNYVEKDGRCVCKEGFYQNKNGKCVQCDCKKCSYDQIKDKAICEYCFDENQIIVEGSCTDSCKPKFYFKNGKCVPCDVECSECNNEGKCEICEVPNAEAPDCLACNKGFYMDKNECRPCHPNCPQCKSEYDYCIGSCEDELKEFSSNWCLCIDEYYMDTTDYKCKPCAPPCKTCLTETICGQGGLCLDKHKLSETNCEKCKHGYFLNSDELCEPCESPCLQCISKTECIGKCEGENRDGENNCICLKGYYECGEKSCCPCIDSVFPFCETCVDKETCIDCVPPRVLNSDNQCVCKKGFYDQDGECEPCSYKCKICQGGADLNCSPCNGANRDEDERCDCNVNGYYELNRICTPCSDPNSTKCDGETSLDCIDELMQIVNKNCQCPKGYFLKDKQCIKCGDCCTDCTSKDTCISCQDNRDKDNDCLPLQGYYAHSINCSVDKCKFEHKCSNCQYIEKQYSCIKCILPFVLIDGSCECPNGHFEEDGECKPCPDKCPNCINLETCVKPCPSETRNNEGNCECLPGFVENQPQKMHCNPCLAKCATCSEKPSQCLTCKNNCKRDIEKNCDCIEGYFEDINGVCQKCDSSCETCKDNKENCIKCISPLENKLEAPECTKCEVGYYFKGRNQTCEPCHYTCKTCVNSKDCVTCKGENRDQGKYQCPCSSGFREDPETKQCIKCHYSKKECDPTECYGNRIYNEKDDTCPCPVKYWDQEGTPMCQECTGNCLKCTSNKICDECVNGYYSNGELCERCDDTCATCNGPLATDCLECRKGMNKDEIEKDCDCPEGTKWDQGKRDCVGCKSCCAQCKNDKCYVAHPGSYTYGKTCGTCKSNCKTCNNETECTQCKSSLNKLPLCLSCMELFFDCNYKGPSIKVCKDDVNDNSREFDFNVKSIRGDFDQGAADLYLNFGNKNRTDTAVLTVSENVKCLEQTQGSFLQKYQDKQFYFRSKTQQLIQKLENQGRLKNLLQMKSMTDSEFKGEEEIQRIEMHEVIGLDQQ